MSADPTTGTEVWSAWENHVVGGAFPLRRFLGGSDHSAVFLTECEKHGVAEAAIKLIPADITRAEERLAQWRAAAALSHPHLARVFDFGRCHLDGREYLYVVTEYAEQTLSQVLAGRALNANEVRELLRPVLEALAFLHQQGLAQSALKPSNLLAINDQLKVATDTVCRAGAPASDVVSGSVYEAPELRDGKASIASDIWALGVIIAQALTQSAPVWVDSLRETVRLPANIPLSFAGIVRRCLAQSPATRPTAFELLAPYKSASQIQVTSAPLPPVQESSSSQTANPRGLSGMFISLLAIAGALVVFLVVWATLRSPS